MGSVYIPGHMLYILLRLDDSYMCQQVIFGSGNGLAPIRRQAITWTIDDLL